MSRSGYTDDYDDIGSLNLYRANVDRALSGKRGQAFLREMVAALDAMPVKELVADELVRDATHVCAIGAAKTFGIARAMAAEIAYENDESGRAETPAQRWERMRAWARGQIVGPVPGDGPALQE